MGASEIYNAVLMRARTRTKEHKEDVTERFCLQGYTKAKLTVYVPWKGVGEPVKCPVSRQMQTIVLHPGYPAHRPPLPDRLRTGTNRSTRCHEGR